MTDPVSFPPLHDLAPGELEARKRHLLSEIARGPQRPRFGRSWRGGLGVAVAIAALAGAGVAIAAGFGAFNGISAAQDTKIGSVVLPPAVLAQMKQMNAESRKLNAQAAKSSGPHFQMPLLLLDTARVLGTAPDGGKVYGLTDTRGDLCILGAMGGGCGPPLTHSHPITLGAGNPGPIPPGGTLTVGGVAIDGVTSVSFTIWREQVTVPVRHNVYVYVKPDTNATEVHCVVAHFADGSSVDAFPEDPCP